jgi:hypothetical protein
MSSVIIILHIRCHICTFLVALLGGVKAMKLQFSRGVIEIMSHYTTCM